MFLTSTTSIRLFGLTLLLGCLLSPTVTPGQALKPTSATLDIFFSGKRRSNLEPCGCRSKQTGGLQYEATIYQQLAATSASLRLDVGEWTNPIVAQSPVDAMKTRYLLRGLSLMKFDAVGFGPSDALLDPDYFKNIRAKDPQALAEIISANVYEKSRPEELAFAPYRVMERTLANGTPVRIGITAASSLPRPERERSARLLAPAISFSGSGIGARRNSNQETITTSRDETAYVIKPSGEALKPVVEVLRAKVDLLVVLYAGDLASARALVRKFPLIGCLVINGRDVDPKSNSTMEGRTPILMAPNVQGREVGRARLVLVESAAKWRLAENATALAIGPDYPRDKSLQALLDTFKQETRSLEVRLPEPNVKKLYGGARTCAACHPRQYEQWRKTPHARALQTLVDKGQQFNPECLKCHVTGFCMFNGFYTVTHAPSLQMANVQCEICHGAAYEHADTQQTLKTRPDLWMTQKEYKALVQRAQKVGPNTKIAETLCMGCHTPENDDYFIYTEKVRKLKH